MLGYPHLLLADFGIARLDQNASTTQPIGTPYFMAPEQWIGHPVPATDQYALAIMIFYLITGQYPFSGDIPALAILHTKEKPPRPSTLNPQLPQEIDTVLLRALEKKPHKRYSSVTEFAEAFDKAAALPLLPPPDPNDGDKENKDHRVLRQISTATIGRPKTIGIALILLVTLFATSGGIFLSHYQNTIKLQNKTATASINKQTAIAQNNATSTAKANSTATAQANTAATAQASATAAAQTTAIASGQLVEPTASETINEHFGKDDATNPYGWQHQNGCLLTPTGYSVTEIGKTTFHACFAESQSFNNFTYQVAFNITRGDCAGIVFRSDSGNANYYAFYICTNQSFYFYKFANNQITPTSDTGSSNNIRTGPTGINVIAVVAKGNSLHFFVNSNQSIYNTPDSSYTGGEIGVIAVDQSKPTTVVFLTAQVYNL